MGAYALCVCELESVFVCEFEAAYRRRQAKAADCDGDFDVPAVGVFLGLQVSFHKFDGSGRQ